VSPVMATLLPNPLERTSRWPRASPSGSTPRHVVRTRRPRPRLFPRRRARALQRRRRRRSPRRQHRHAEGVFDGHVRRSEFGGCNPGRSAALEDMDQARASTGFAGLRAVRHEDDAGQSRDRCAELRPG
jgi:hypothetical protein